MSEESLELITIRVYEATENIVNIKDKLESSLESIIQYFKDKLENRPTLDLSVDSINSSGHMAFLNHEENRSNITCVITSFHNPLEYRNFIKFHLSYEANNKLDMDTGKYINKNYLLQIMSRRFDDIMTLNDKRKVMSYLREDLNRFISKSFKDLVIEMGISMAIHNPEIHSYILNNKDEFFNSVLEYGELRKNILGD